MKKQSNASKARLARAAIRNLKRKKSKKNNASSESLRILKPNEININKEVRYLLSCAEKREGKLIVLGALILFSTEEGDAWMIDPEDKGANCLMEGFERKPVKAFDTENQYIVEWESLYKIDGDCFMVQGVDKKVSIYFNFPVSEIQEATKRFALDG